MIRLTRAHCTRHQYICTTQLPAPFMIVWLLLLVHPNENLFDSYKRKCANEKKEITFFPILCTRVGRQLNTCHNWFESTLFGWLARSTVDSECTPIIIYFFVYYFYYLSHVERRSIKCKFIGRSNPLHDILHFWFWSFNFIRNDLCAFRSKFIAHCPRNFHNVIRILLQFIV